MSRRNGDPHQQLAETDFWRVTTTIPVLAAVPVTVISKW
nr:MAG TPA: hypothetical protein [Caudoviricetes sp.]